jgi:hypothetical protein
MQSSLPDQSDSDNYASTMQRPAQKISGLFPNDNITSVGAGSVLKGGFVLSEADQNQPEENLEIGNVQVIYTEDAARVGK